VRTGAFAIAASLFVATPAFAQSKQECAEAYTQAQVARKESRLKEAKDKLTLCANASCPAALRKDCTPWLAEVEADLPTVTVKPVDETGRVVDGARISVDGTSVTRDGDVATLRLDPGEHVVRIEADGKKAAEQKITVAKGAPRRELTLKLDAEGRVATEPTSPPKAEGASRPVPALVWVFGGIGVAGVATFAVLGSIGKGKKGDLDTRMCKPHCDPGTVSAIKTDYNAADVALAVGGVAMAAGLVVFLTRPEAKPEETSVILAPRPGGASLLVRF
jgi:hypothetical protein